MRWLRQRRQPVRRTSQRLGPLPDGDRVQKDDGRDVRQIVAELLDPAYRVVGRAAMPPPLLMTVDAEWRVNGGGVA